MVAVLVIEGSSARIEGPGYPELYGMVDAEIAEALGEFGPYWLQRRESFSLNARVAIVNYVCQKRQMGLVGVTQERGESGTAYCFYLSCLQQL